MDGMHPDPDSDAIHAEMYTRIFHLSPTLLAVTHPQNGRIVDVNETWVRITGIAKEEALGKTALELNLWANPVDRARVLEDLNQNGFAKDKEVTFRFRDRQATYLTSAVFIEVGSDKYVLWEFCDITDRKQAELSLRESERRFRELLENLRQVAVMFDTGGIVTFCNDFMLGLSGWSREELIGQHMAKFIPADLHDLLRQRLEVAMVNPELMAFTECELLCKNGTRRLMQWNHNVLRDHSGNITGFASLGFDITEHRALEERYLQSQKLEGIGRLAGGVAHDFNNLLTVINGYGSMVLGHLAENDPLRKQVEAIVKAGDRAATLTQQLLTFSRKEIAKPQCLRLNTMVLEAKDMFGRLLGEDIELVTRLEARPDRILADPGQMQQVLMNLVVNARDAMPGGGRLTIQTTNRLMDYRDDSRHPDEAPGLYVVLSVVDTGCGMDHEMLQHVFEPFFTTKQAGRGTGLGLSTVYGIVKQSGGFLRVESTPGLGSRFNVYLPLDESRSEAAEPARLAEDLRGSATILLVEDEQSVRELAAEILRSYGYRVLVAASGPEAIRLSANFEGRIDLLLTDVVMPGVSGRAVAERLQPSRPEMKVLFTSGYADHVMGNRGVLTPDLTLLPKPFSPEELGARVRRILRAGGARRTVLVIDDEPEVVALINELLGQQYNVLAASDGNAGLEILRSQPGVDLVITDLVMPNADGIETIRAIRKFYPALKIIAMSGAFGGHFLKTARMLGAHATLFKPIDVDQLRHAIQQVFAEPA